MTPENRIELMEEAIVDQIARCAADLAGMDDDGEKEAANPYMAAGLAYKLAESAGKRMAYHRIGTICNEAARHAAKNNAAMNEEDNRK